MATWTPITDAALEPGKPIRSVDGLALRDNPIAISEGATGAPRIRTAALQPPAAGTSTLLLEILGDDEFGGTGSGVSTTFPPVSYPTWYQLANHVGFTVLVAGVVRVSIDHTGDFGGPGDSFLRVLKNGTEIQSWTNTQPAYETRTLDITVAVGDKIIFQHRDNNSENVAWKNIKVFSDNPDMAVSV